MYELFLKGLVVGFAIAAPVGPIGILCIRRTLQFGRLSGFFSGLGAALADCTYGCMATLGLPLLLNFFLEGQLWFRLIGGLFLVFLGVRTYVAKVGENSSIRVTHKTLLSDFFSTFFLTLTNPMTVIAFLAIFAIFGIASAGKVSSVIVLVSGIFFGSACWWFLLSEGVTFFRKKIGTQMMLWINRIAGILLVLLGLLAAMSFLYKK